MSVLYLLILAAHFSGAVGLDMPEDIQHGSSEHITFLHNTVAELKSSHEMHANRLTVLEKGHEMLVAGHQHVKEIAHAAKDKVESMAHSLVQFKQDHQAQIDAVKNHVNDLFAGMHAKLTGWHTKLFGSKK